MSFRAAVISLSGVIFIMNVMPHFCTPFHMGMKSLSARESPTIVSSWNDDDRCEINFCVWNVENESTDFIISDRAGDINSF